MKVSDVRKHLAEPRPVAPEPPEDLMKPYTLHYAPETVRAIAHRKVPDREIDEVSFVIPAGCDYRAGHHMRFSKGSLMGSEYIVTRVTNSIGPHGDGNRVYLMERGRFMKKHAIGEP